jgi:DNA primase
LYQAGLQNVIAASGTALTTSQVDLLRRLDVKRLMLLFDADTAGQNAARKVVDIALDAGIAPYSVRLPDGADPDSFVRQFGAEAFRKYALDERRDFVGFLVDRGRAAGQLSSPEGTADLANEIMLAVARVEDPVLQDQLVLRAAEELRVPDASLRPILRKLLDPRRSNKRPERRRFETEGDSATPSDAPPRPRGVVLPEESELLRLMLQQGMPMVEHVLTRLSVGEFSEGEVRDVVETLVDQYQAGAIDRDVFVRGDKGEAVRGLVTETLAVRHSLSSDNWQRRIGMTVPERDGKPFEVADSAIKLLRLHRVKEAVAALMLQMSQDERNGEDVTALAQRINELNVVRQAIERGGAET